VRAVAGCALRSARWSHGTGGPNGATFGSVYLVKSGPYYKIGSTNAVGRREYELAIQLPEKAAGLLKTALFYGAVLVAGSFTAVALLGLGVGWLRNPWRK
jgi:hypothetical protein